MRNLQVRKPLNDVDIVNTCIQLANEVNGGIGCARVLSSAEYYDNDICEFEGVSVMKT